MIVKSYIGTFSLHYSNVPPVEPRTPTPMRIALQRETSMIGQNQGPIFTPAPYAFRDMHATEDTMCKVWPFPFQRLLLSVCSPCSRYSLLPSHGAGSGTRGRQYQTALPTRKRNGSYRDLFRQLRKKVSKSPSNVDHCWRRHLVVNQHDRFHELPDGQSSITAPDTSEGPGLIDSGRPRWSGRLEDFVVRGVSGRNAIVWPDPFTAANRGIAGREQFTPEEPIVFEW